MIDDLDDHRFDSDEIKIKILIPFVMVFMI